MFFTFFFFFRYAASTMDVPWEPGGRHLYQQQRHVVLRGPVVWDHHLRKFPIPGEFPRAQRQAGFALPTLSYSKILSGSNLHCSVSYGNSTNTWQSKPLQYIQLFRFSCYTSLILSLLLSHRACLITRCWSMWGVDTIFLFPRVWNPNCECHHCLFLSAVV